MMSGSSVFLIKENKTIQKLLLAFSGAFLLGISFTHLLPEIFIQDGVEEACSHVHTHVHEHGNTLKIGVFVLLGFLIQLFLELLTQGIEHGHAHVDEHSDGMNPVGLMLGLCVHSFLEGMPLVGHFSDVQHTLSIGIIIHNIPISIVLMSLFLNSGKTKKQALVLLAVFALMTPMGSMFSYLISDYLTGDMTIYFNMIMAVVVGIFLHVATSILFEASESHHYNKKKFLMVVLGMATAILL